MELSERIYNGNRANEVLENEAYISAFQQIEQEIIEQWKSSPARDEEGRQKLWLMLQLLNKVQSTLRSTLETGKLANLEMEHKRTLLQRAKDAML